MDDVPSGGGQPRCYAGPAVGAVFLTCCVRGLEETRHFTPELGGVVLAMLAFALVVGGMLLLASPLLLHRRRA